MVKLILLTNTIYIAIKIIEAHHHSDTSDESEYDEENVDYTVKRRFNSGGKLPPYKEYDSHDDHDEYEEDDEEERGRDNSVMPLQPQPNLVLVPYPYALVMPNNKKASTPWETDKATSPTQPSTTQNTTTTTTTTTTQATTTAATKTTTAATTTTTTAATTISSENDYPPTHRKLGFRYGNINNDGKIALRALRKTNPTWVPKYGIVPIPDTLAEKLMSQLRKVKGFQIQKY